LADAVGENGAVVEVVAKSILEMAVVDQQSPIKKIGKCSKNCFQPLF